MGLSCFRFKKFKKQWFYTNCVSISYETIGFALFLLAGPRPRSRHQMLLQVPLAALRGPRCVSGRQPPCSTSRRPRGAAPTLALPFYPPLACLLVSSAYVGHVTSLAAVVRTKVPASAFSEYSLEMAIWPVFRFTQPA